MRLPEISPRFLTAAWKSNFRAQSADKFGTDGKLRMTRFEPSVNNIRHGEVRLSRDWKEGHGQITDREKN
ncbi:hypothetical protein RRG08_023265 [Elysia crispata]|uniref:Uncharacterized protein n=1 Tax=Elysia crispata TaxID=231223 RepID=A0AAE1CKA2_9GAST|nr:hypothetical protein RRG08_023265 [Elysia crispata]